jgi:hypothetical protein
MQRAEAREPPEALPAVLAVLAVLAGAVTQPRHLGVATLGGGG